MCICIFIAFVLSKRKSGFVVLLYKEVVRLLPVPTCKILEFFKRLSMLKKCFKFGTQSRKTNKSWFMSNLFDEGLNLFF